MNCLFDCGSKRKNDLEENVIRDLPCSRRRSLSWDTNFAMKSDFAFPAVALMCSLSLKIKNIVNLIAPDNTQLLLDVTDMTVVSGMTITWGTCKQDCRNDTPCCLSSAVELSFLRLHTEESTFHLFRNEQMKQNTFI